MRESPALDIMELLAKRGAVISYTDPYVPTLSHGGQSGKSVDFEQALAAGFDCAVVATDHAVFDYAAIGRLPLVVDTRNALAGATAPTIFRL